MRTNRFYFFSDGCWQGERSLSFLQRESIYHREKLPWACLLWHCNKVTLSRPKSLGLRHSLPNDLGLRCSLPRPNEPYSCSVVMTGNSGNTEVFIVFFFFFFVAASVFPPFSWFVFLKVKSILNCDVPNNAHISHNRQNCVLYSIREPFKNYLADFFR